MDSDMDKNRYPPPEPGQFLRWAVGAVAMVAIILAGLRIFINQRETSAPPLPVADSAPLPAPKADEAHANWAPASFTIHAADGLRQTSDSSWSVKGGRAFMQVRRLDDGALEFRFVYPFDELLPDETNALLRTRWSLGSSEALVKKLNITPEQLGQLKAVSPATDIPVASSDRQSLKALFDDYLAATDKSATEKALVEAMVALDAKYYDPTMQMVGSLAAQVRQIFTEEQWAGLLRRYGNPNRAGSSRLR
jgi:hypothetical protein